MARSTAIDVSVAAWRVWAAAQKEMRAAHSGVRWWWSSSRATNGLVLSPSTMLGVPWPGRRPAVWARAVALRPRVTRVQHSWPTNRATKSTSNGCQAARLECIKRSRAISGTRVNGAANVRPSQMAVDPSILLATALFFLFCFVVVPSQNSDAMWLMESQWEFYRPIYWKKINN